jgi:hypothetical protein
MWMEVSRMRIILFLQALRGSSANCKQRFATTTAASAIILYQIFGTPLSFSSPPSALSGLLSYLLSVLWLIPYALFYIAPYPWLLIIYIIFCITNPRDLMKPENTISKVKKRDNRIKLGLTAEACSNRVVWCVENLLPTMFATAIQWQVWTELNSPWRGLLPFDPNAEWLGGTGSDAMYWILTLLWTPVLAVLGFSTFVVPSLVWIYALDDALDGMSELNWKGIGVEGEKPMKEDELK